MLKKEKRLESLINRLIYVLERINLTEYIEYLQSPSKIIWYNFVIGIAKGVGSAVGFSILGTILIYILAQLGILNIQELMNFLKGV